MTNIRLRHAPRALDVREHQELRRRLHLPVTVRAEVKVFAARLPVAVRVPVERSCPARRHPLDRRRDAAAFPLHPFEHVGEADRVPQLVVARGLRYRLHQRVVELR